jgi:transcriptional regulator with XRE-family HTH domain
MEGIMTSVEPGGTETQQSGANGIGMFAAEFKAHRAAHGWTQVLVGDKVGYSGSYISDVERADRLPSTDFAERCDEAFGTPGTFKRLQEGAKRNAYPAFFAPVVEFEAKAIRIHGWELGSVPGLFQTEDYARALITVTEANATVQQIDRLVTARMERQGILAKDTAPMIWYVIDEATLRRVVGGTEIMRIQIDRLIGQAETPRIVIQVLTFADGTGVGSDGPIAIYDFADGDPAVSWCECSRGGRLVDNAKEVAEVVTDLSLIRASALSPRASIEFMRKVRGDLA